MIIKKRNDNENGIPIKKRNDNGNEIRIKRRTMITFKETNLSQKYYMLLGDLKLYSKTSLLKMFTDYGIPFPINAGRPNTLLIVLQKFIICKKIALLTEVEEPISPLFVTDSQGRINIFTWFSSSSDLKRFLGCDRTQGLASWLCEKRNLTEEEVIQYSDDQLLVHPLVALLAANSMNDNFRAKFNEFFIINRDDQAKGEAIRKQARKARSIFEDEGLVDYVIQDGFPKWPFSDIEHGFYIIQMGNLVKAGGTGMREDETYQSIRRRFATHRNTNCDFKLKALFKFDNSEAVEAFEVVSKLILRKYRRGYDGRLEQYRCPGQDSGEVIVKIISKLFQKMRPTREDQEWERISEKKVESYNRISAESSAASSPEVSP